MKKWKVPGISGTLLILVGIVCVEGGLLRGRARDPQAAAPQPMSAGNTAVRIMYGELQTAARVYDGSLSVTEGKIVRVIPYRFFRDDALVGANSWKLTLKRVQFENRNGRPSSVAGGQPPQNIVPAGVTALLDVQENARVRVNTAQGDFEFVLSDLPYGRRQTFMSGDVVVERVPVILRSNDEATGEQHDYPSLLQTRKGEVWLAWQAYRDRGDHVYVRRGGTSGWTSPQRITEEKGDLLKTAIGEDSQNRIHVVWSERTREDWNLVDRWYDGRAWSSRVAITSGHGTNIHQRMLSDSDGNLHLVWIAFKDGKSFVAYARFAGNRWTEPADISGPGAWAPDLAVDSRKNVYVAWDSYRAGNYDIFLRKTGANGQWGPAQQVTRSPRFQAHPSVAVDSLDRAWVAWDESGVNWGKDWTHDSPYRSTVLYADRKIALAVFDGGEWKQPQGDPNASLPTHLGRFAQHPRIQFDSAGRLWMLFQSRTSVNNNREDYWAAGGRWELFATALDGDAWMPAVLFPQSVCRVEAPFGLAAIQGGGIHFAWPTDNRVFLGGGAFGAATAGRYEVYSTAMKLDGSPRSSKLEPFAEATAAGIGMHPNENADVERIRGHRIRMEGKDLRILRGDFHRHTDISNDGAGDGSVEDFYRYMIDAAQMDTGIIGDHNMGGDVEYNWWRTEKSYDVYHIRDGFTPLFGYERSVAYPNGHRNVVFDHRGVRTLPISPDENQGRLNTGPVLYPYLRQNRGICMEHSLATNQGTDWRDNDPELEPLVELYQGYHANYEYEGAPLGEATNYLVRIHGGYQPAGFFWNALAKGLKLGVQASSDHISTHTSYAMIYTPSTARADIVQAMRERHAYAATDNIILDVQAADGERQYMMGDIFDTRSRKVRFKIRVIGTDSITRLDVIKNNTFAFTRAGEGKEMNVEFVDESPRSGENYYYVRVQQIDRNMAWSSPIWVRY